MPNKKKNTTIRDKRQIQTLNFDSPAKLANELMFAKHSMKETELKIWLTTIASLAKNQTVDQSTIYEFNMVELANKLRINKDTGWRNIIREALDSVSDKSLKILKRYSEYENKQNWIKIPLYEYVNHNDFLDTISVAVNPRILPYLQDFTERFTQFDIEEMIAIKGLVQIKVFMIVKELLSEHQYSITIDKFKERLNMPTTTYSKFKDFQREVLKKAEQQIRKHTSFKDFHFSHDGRGNKPATTITIHLSDDTKKLNATSKKETLEDKINALDEGRMKLFDELSYCGVTPQSSCYNLVTKYSVEVLKSNLEYFKEKQKSRMNDRQEPLNAGYLIQCIKKDYAKPNRKSLLRQANTNELLKNEVIQTDIKLEDAYKQCKVNASKIIKKGNLNDLLDLFDSASISMQNMAQAMGIKFDIDQCRLNIQRRDLRNKDTLFFREHIAQRLMSGYIKMEDYIG